MSLSEPRKRRKNPMHSINLSAQNHWSNDDSKFGQRMLEKFGWSKGSGLGKKQQGISENIKIQHKVVPTGLGFVAHNADDWFKAGEDYSRLLSQLTEKFDQYKTLSEEIDDTNSKKSLVQNSLNSKSRVHYHKFTKGKDLTQYKKDELACILGKGAKDDDQSLNGLNMKEYFKTKRESKKIKTNNNDLSINEDSVVNIDDEVNERIIQKETSEHEINTIPIKKKKREIKLSENSNHIEPNECNNIEVKEKKKKSKIVIDNDVNEEVKTKLKKSKKELGAQESPDLEQSKHKKSNDIFSEDLNNAEQIKKKKKKTKIIVSEDLNDEENTKCEYANSTKIEKELDSESELVLTHKYKNLVDLLIENSSAGKKYCKNSPSSLFEKKIQEFASRVKLQSATTISSNEVKPADEESTYVPIKLNPDDKNFVKDFEAHKSKVLESISKKQEVAKYVNEKSMFVAQHGDVLFFGSNINEIKGYGNW